MTQSPIDQIIHGNALKVLDKLDSESIDLVLTDPPYFLDGFDDQWDTKRMAKNYKYYAVESMVPGMKFDHEQGKRLYKWFLKVSRKLFRVLKPGGFAFVFASPRLYHQVTCAMDDAGFNIRDCFLWLYTQNQPKAMGLQHFVRKLDIPEKEKLTMLDKLNGWKTPQIKSCFEPIAVAQKPYEGTLLKNFLAHNVGLFNTTVQVGQNMFPSNVLLVEKIDEYLDRYFLIPKPTRKEKGTTNIHFTVKPLLLCQHLIQLASVPNAIILDPFVGTGTTCVAAKSLGRHYIGIETQKDYVDIALKRLQSKLENEKAENTNIQLSFSTKS
jgi:site-specific DNA-methyltransferase (adenine-specific)